MMNKENKAKAFHLHPLGKSSVDVGERLGHSLLASSILSPINTSQNVLDASKQSPLASSTTPFPRLSSSPPLQQQQQQQPSAPRTESKAFQRMFMEESHAPPHETAAPAHGQKPSAAVKVRTKATITSGTTTAMRAGMKELKRRQPHANGAKMSTQATRTPLPSSTAAARSEGGACVRGRGKKPLPTTQHENGQRAGVGSSCHCVPARESFERALWLLNGMIRVEHGGEAGEGDAYDCVEEPSSGVVVVVAATPGPGVAPAHMARAPALPVWLITDGQSLLVVDSNGSGHHSNYCTAMTRHLQGLSQASPLPRTSTSPACPASSKEPEEEVSVAWFLLDTLQRNAGTVDVVNCLAYASTKSSTVAQSGPRKSFSSSPSEPHKRQQQQQPELSLPSPGALATLRTPYNHQRGSLLMLLRGAALVNAILEDICHCYMPFFLEEAYPHGVRLEGRWLEAKQRLWTSAAAASAEGHPCCGESIDVASQERSDAIILRQLFPAADKEATLDEWRARYGVLNVPAEVLDEVASSLETRQTKFSGERSEWKGYTTIGPVVAPVAMTAVTVAKKGRIHGPTRKTEQRQQTPKRPEVVDKHGEVLGGDEEKPLWSGIGGECSSVVHESGGFPGTGRRLGGTLSQQETRQRLGQARLTSSATLFPSCGTALDGELREKIAAMQMVPPTPLSQGTSSPPSSSGQRVTPHWGTQGEALILGGALLATGPTYASFLQHTQSIQISGAKQQQHEVKQSAGAAASVRPVRAPAQCRAVLVHTPGGRVELERDVTAFTRTSTTQASPSTLERMVTVKDVKETLMRSALGRSLRLRAEGLFLTYAPGLPPLQDTDVITVEYAVLRLVRRRASAGSM